MEGHEVVADRGEHEYEEGGGREGEWKQKVYETVERFGKLTFNTSAAHSQSSDVALH